MKTYELFLICSSMLLLFVTSLHAQDIEPTAAWSLEEIWKAAEKNNRQLKLSALNLEQSSLEILEAKDRLLPDLSIAGDAKANSKFLLYEHGLFSAPSEVPVKGYGYGVGYNLNYTLFNGGKDRRGVQMKEEEERHRLFENDLQKYSVKYNVATTYFELYKQLHFRDFLVVEIQAEQKQLTLIENLYKNGIVLKSDVLRILVKLAQLALALAEVRKSIDIRTQRLNIFMGRAEDASLMISYGGDFETMEMEYPDYGDYLALAIQESPAYQMVNSDIKWSELNRKQIKAMLLPKISLYSNYNYSYPQVTFYPYSSDLWGFGQTGVRVQFSIDNLYKSKHSIARAQVATNQAKEKAHIKKDELAMQIKEAYLQQQQAVESVATAEENILKTTEVVRVIQNSYLNQESLLTDLLEAENALLEAKFNRITAQVNVKIGHIRLLAIVGIL